MSYFKIIKNEEDDMMVYHSETHERVLNWHDGIAQFIRDKILKNSPEQNEDFFVVPKVVE